MRQPSMNQVLRSALSSALVATVALGGCANVSDTNCPGNGRCIPADAGPICHDPPASLADCQRVGASYADCGGAPGPYLACEPSGNCRWFTGACMPPSFRPSACSADAVCCHDDWPWPTPDGSAGPELLSAFNFLYGFGSAPWSSESSRNVVVVPVPADLPERGLTCAGVVTPLSSPCHAPFDTVEQPPVSRFGPRGAILRREARQLAGWELLIEVEGTLARVCILPFTDFRPSMCTPPETWPGACAVSGTVSLDGTTGTLDVVFPDGGTVSGRF